MSVRDPIDPILSYQLSLLLELPSTYFGISARRGVGYSPNLSKLTRCILLYRRPTESSLAIAPRIASQQFYPARPAPIRAELKSIRRDLDDLREKVENVIGFQKEIDHALERIAAIEKHLGINKKIAA